MPFPNDYMFASPIMCMDGISVDVLLIGFLERDGNGDVICSETSSSSTLIRCPGHNIVVDTGSSFMKAGIKTSLKQIGIFPDEVDIVILTHNHEDHVGNVGMFPKARIIMHSGDEPYKGAEIVDGPEHKICQGVKMVHTPGHTEGSCSVFVEGDRAYAITGDACPLKDNFLKCIPPRLNCDEEAAKASLKLISDYADVVIPGHGGPFFTRKAGGERKPRGKKRRRRHNLYTLSVMERV